MYTVYEHINMINGKIYVGITKQNPEDRWGQNGINYKNDCPKLWSAISSYGWDNFYHMIVDSDLTKEEACYVEEELIKKYKTQDDDFGYNILSGGQCPDLTPEVREKMSISMRGNKNGLGKPCSEEKRKKISEAQKGRKLTEDHKHKLSIAASNRHIPCSEEKRKALQLAYPNQRPVYCKESNTVYRSVQECARELNLYPSLVSKACSGKLHTTGGYHLNYNDNVINA